jgi:hypothetical protein
MKLRFGLALLLFSVSAFLPVARADQSCVSNSDCDSPPQGQQGVCCNIGGVNYCVYYDPKTEPAPTCGNS